MSFDKMIPGISFLKSDHPSQRVFHLCIPFLVDERLYISSEDLDLFKTFDLYNSNGVKILEGDVFNNEINVEILPIGNYWIQLYNKEKTIWNFKQFIKM